MKPKILELEQKIKDLNEMQSKILELEQKIKKLEDYEVYSTDEKEIGTWIDGKPIYRKVIHTGIINSSQGFVMPHGIENIDKIIYMYGFAYTNSGVYCPLPRVGVDTSVTIQLGVNKSDIIMSLGSNVAFDDSYLVLEYIKS